MPLSLGSFTFPGSFLLLPGPFEYQRQPNSVFGVSGQTVLTGLRTTRALIAEAWIYNSFFYAADLLAYLDSLEQEAGTIDLLTESNAFLGTRTFDDVEFQHWELSLGPIWSDTLQSWLAIGKLYFLQITPP